MALLFSNEILDSVKKELQNATSSVQIITAYCKKSTFDYLNSFISENVRERKLLVRLRMEDVLKNSTDFEILKDGISSGWKVFIRFDLHAKTYIVDNKRGLVGSANATNSGLSLGKNGNMEVATLVDIEPKDIDKIDKLYRDAIFVDDDLIVKLQQQIDSIPPSERKNSHSWDSSITTLFNPHIDTLFSYEMPEDFELKEGEYFIFLDDIYRGDRKEFKEAFRWSNAYLWLLTVLGENNGSMFFGELSAKLHEAMISDPKPYRRDVKKMLINLLTLITELEMSEIVIDRPNYSQRISLRD